MRKTIVTIISEPCAVYTKYTRCGGATLSPPKNETVYPAQRKWTIEIWFYINETERESFFFSQNKTQNPEISQKSASPNVFFCTFTCASFTFSTPKNVIFFFGKTIQSIRGHLRITLYLVLTGWCFRRVGCVNSISTLADPVVTAHGTLSPLPCCGGDVDLWPVQLFTRMLHLVDPAPGLS